MTKYKLNYSFQWIDGFFDQFFQGVIFTLLHIHAVMNNDFYLKYPFSGSIKR